MQISQGLSGMNRAGLGKHLQLRKYFILDCEIREILAGFNLLAFKKCKDFSFKPYSSALQFFS